MSLELGHHNVAEPSRVSQPAIAQREHHITIRDLLIEFGGREDRRFEKRIIDRIGSIEVSAFDQVTADRCAEELYAGCAKSTLKRQFYGPLLRAFRCAASRGLCALPSIRVPAVKHAPKPVWLLPAVFDHAVHFAPRNLVVQMHILVGTGMQPSELFALRWNDIDLEQKLIVSGERVLAVRPHVEVILRTLQRAEAPNVILTPNGRPYARRRNSGGHNKSALYRLRRQAVVPNFNLTALSHTYAVWHLALHRNWNRLKNESGWSDYRLRKFRWISDEVLDQTREELLGLYNDPPAGIWSAGLFATPEEEM